MVICIDNKCKKQAIFGFIDDIKPSYCKEHKRELMIDIHNKTCLECSKQPSFGFKDDKAPTYCSIHKKEGMVNVVNKTCLECNKQPTFGFENDKKPTYCKEHKKEGMINIKTKTCLECSKHPSFGFKDDKKATYCVSHKKEGMINIKDRTCLECSKRPCYGYPDDKTPTYCKEHSKEGMIDIKHKMCLECSKRPHFGFKDDKKPTYCVTHKKEGMIEITNKRCLECSKQSHYGFIGGKKLYCSQHKKDKMVNLSTTKQLCKHCEANYDLEFECKNCISRKISSERIEHTIMRYLSQHIVKKPDSLDRPINNCSGRKPDAIYDCLTHIVILEIDEHQHRSYQHFCECSRVSELVNAVGGMPVHFIRFNPHNFYIKDKKISDIHWTKRMDILTDTLKYNIDNLHEGFVRITQLYYDKETDEENYVDSEDITEILKSMKAII